MSRSEKMHKIVGRRTLRYGWQMLSYASITDPNLSFVIFFHFILLALGAPLQRHGRLYRPVLRHTLQIFIMRVRKMHMNDGKQGYKRKYINVYHHARFSLTIPKVSQDRSLYQVEFPQHLYGRNGRLSNASLPNANKCDNDSMHEKAARSLLSKKAVNSFSLAFVIFFLSICFFFVLSIVPFFSSLFHILQKIYYRLESLPPENEITMRSCK